jgi:hypothetical protein
MIVNRIGKWRLPALALGVVMLCSPAAEAKWWIFGQSKDDVDFGYLYLNQVSYEELGGKATLYRETLPNGELVLRGKARSGRNQVGGVRVSLDGKATWQKATFKPSGEFEFRFRPEADRTYQLAVEVMDTTGKTNDVERTRKELTVSPQRVSDQARRVLDGLVAAYREENAAAFMQGVSPDFAGDAASLDRAIRKDFTAFDRIDLRYTLNNVVTDPAGRLFVAINFNRSVTSSRSGQTFTDQGSTEFVIQPGEQGGRVFSMKHPLIFGLSDAENVATGSVAGGADEAALIAVDGQGNVGVGQVSTANTEDGSFTLNVSCVNFTCSYPGFDFANQALTQGGVGDINLETNLFFPAFNQVVGWQVLGAVGINTVREAPASGYTAQGGPMFQVEPNLGNTVALQLPSGKYALLEVVSYTDLDGNGSTRSTFRFKYQPDGSRKF